MRTFALTTSGAGGILKQTITKYQSATGSDTQDAYDEYGNVLRIQVTTGNFKLVMGTGTCIKGFVGSNSIGNSNLSWRASFSI